MIKQQRYRGPGCSASNKHGFPCWAPPTTKNPMHEQLPLCWTHLAMLAITGWQKQHEQLQSNNQRLEEARAQLAELNGQGSERGNDVTGINGQGQQDRARQS